MIAEEFRPEHVPEILAHIARCSAHAVADEAYCQMLKSAGPCATLRNDAGDIIACAGLRDIEDGSYLWAFVSSIAPRYKKALLQGAQRLMEIARRPTVATVEYGFLPGWLFLERLGMRYRTDLDNFGPLGESYHVFEKVD